MPCFNQSDTSISTFSNGTNQQQAIRNGTGASTNLDSPYRSSAYVEEGRIMSLQLPTGKKGNKHNNYLTILSKKMFTEKTHCIFVIFINLQLTNKYVTI